MNFVDDIWSFQLSFPSFLQAPNVLRNSLSDRRIHDDTSCINHQSSIATNAKRKKMLDSTQYPHLTVKGFLKFINPKGGKGGIHLNFPSSGRLYWELNKINMKMGG